LVVRSFYYFRTGYATYLNFIMTMITLSTTLYYLALEKMPLLQGVFQNVVIFGFALVCVVYPVGVWVGWMHFKRAQFFKVEQDVIVESNPYSQDRLTPIMVPMWRAIMRMAAREGFDVAEMQKILEKSCK
jgi:hypothetical protein